MKPEKVVQCLEALAQESRLEIFRMLLKNGEIAAGELAKNLGLPNATLSFHLSILKKAKLIEARKDGRSILYTAKKGRAKKVTRYIKAEEALEELV
jgi:ArsR family transcriptional regulator, arsenate/arsenite/antimonite-responsive transcriptional repressor